MTKRASKLFTRDTVNGCCVPARLGGAQIREHPSHWLVASEAARGTRSHFVGFEVNNGTWAHPVLRCRRQRSVLAGRAV